MSFGISASRDDNRVPSLIGVSSVDGKTPVLIRVDPVTKRLLTDTSVTIDTITLPTPGLGLQPYDYVARVLTNSTTETYTFKSGGAAGATTNTVVVVYTDTALATISTVTKT